MNWNSKYINVHRPYLWLIYAMVIGVAVETVTILTRPTNIPLHIWNIGWFSLTMFIFIKTERDDRRRRR